MHARMQQRKSEEWLQPEVTQRHWLILVSFCRYSAMIAACGKVGERTRSPEERMRRSKCASIRTCGGRRRQGVPNRTALREMVVVKDDLEMPTGLVELERDEQMTSFHYLFFITTGRRPMLTNPPSESGPRSWLGTAPMPDSTHAVISWTSRQGFPLLPPRSGNS